MIHNLFNNLSFVLVLNCNNMDPLTDAHQVLLFIHELTNLSLKRSQAKKLVKYVEKLQVNLNMLLKLYYNL